MRVRLSYSPTALQRFPQQNGVQQSAREAKGDTAEHEVFDAQSLRLVDRERLAVAHGWVCSAYAAYTRHM